MFVVLVIFLLSSTVAQNVQDAHLSHSKSLISLARRDPHEFAQMLNGAPDTSIRKIVALIRAMIETARADIKRVHDEKKRAVDAHVEIKVVLGKKVIECKNLDTNATTATEAVAIADGTLNETVKAYDDAKDGLENEIATLVGVINELEKLKTSPSLVILSSTRKLMSLMDDPKSLVSLLSNADPKAIQEVIVLLQDLILEARKELARLKGNVNDATLALKRATTAEFTAKSISERCVNQKVELEREVKISEAKAIAAKEISDNITTVRKNEINTLKEVIETLLKLISN